MMNPTVLVTDDDEDLRLLCQVQLELGGFDVSQACNGREAIEVARASNPDLILLDLMMPVMDGWEALEQLKADPYLSRIPVFVITGKNQDSDQERAFAMGAAAFIPKPFQGPALIAQIRGHLNGG
jgi:CheY-like chemotaxis protein